MFKPDEWSLTYLFLGITAAGYRHVNYFHGEERRAYQGHRQGEDKVT
jgi:hypothetical protein